MYLCSLLTITILFDVLIAVPLVQLPNGLIQGREDVTIENKTYYAFEKIPFASPPVGKLRFQAPVPPQNWDGVLETTHMDILCFQLGDDTTPNQTEDCLYLNVFTPQLPSEDSDAPLLPVMLYIYGGAFIGGSSDFYRADRLIEQDVVYISINYRIGIFGFLSTQDDVIPGNAGLKDQLLALQWAHDNIDLFGGDPEQITIFGQSAGSASVAYHLLNQQSQGLFRGAIMQSGSFLSPWTYQRNAREVAFATAALIDDSFANSNDSAALLEFLQDVDVQIVNGAAKEFKDSHSSPQFTELYNGLFWAPVIEAKNESAFLTKKQYGLLLAGNVVRVPILIGMTSEESLGLGEYTAEDVLTEALEEFDDHLDWLVPADMNVVDEDKRQEIGTTIRNIYTKGEEFAGNPGALVRLYSDSGFTRPIIKQAELFSRYAPTYFYQFSYDGIMGADTPHYEGADSVAHAADIRYLFCSGQECDFSGFPEPDRLTTERLVKILTNFAKYQNPTPEPSELLQNITWPEVSTETGDFLYVDINEDLEVKNHPKEDSYENWAFLYWALNYTDFDTY